VIGGWIGKMVINDVSVYLISNKRWRVESGTGMDARKCHKLLVSGRWLVTIGGEGKEGSPRDAAKVIDARTWKEALVREDGNRPFEVTRWAFARTGETKGLHFGRRRRKRKRREESGEKKNANEIHEEIGTDPEVVIRRDDARIFRIVEP
jgi:hypothetical protein